MYQRLIGSNPDNAEALNNLAWLLAIPRSGCSIRTL